MSHHVSKASAYRKLNFTTDGNCSQNTLSFQNPVVEQKHIKGPPSLQCGTYKAMILWGLPHHRQCREDERIAERTSKRAAQAKPSRTPGMQVALCVVCADLEAGNLLRAGGLTVQRRGFHRLMSSKPARTPRGWCLFMLLFTDKGVNRLREGI